MSKVTHTRDSIARKATHRAPGAGSAGVGTQLGRFRDDEGGSLVIFSLMLLVAMLFFAGLAVDFMRFESHRTKFQNTLDRAVLAAASLKQTQDPEEVVRDYFEKAGLGKFVGPIRVEETRSSDTVSSRKVVAAAGAKMDPLFLPLMDKVVFPDDGQKVRRWAVREGHAEDAAALTAKRVDFREMPILAYGGAAEGISDLEISMVLDVSGSMGYSSSTGRTKIYELREAAKDFVYHLQCNPNETRSSGAECEVEPGKVSISVVPYSEQVNAGPDLLSEFNVTQEHTNSYCVNFSADDYDSTSMAAYVKDDASALPPAAANILQRTGHFDPWRPTYANRTYSPGDWSCNVSSDRWITPLTDNHNDAIAAINRLSADGNTSVDVGMKWGTALLDPGSRDVVSGLIDSNAVDSDFAGRPYDYGQSYNMKAVILMTDGKNTDQHYLKEQYRDGPSVVWHYTDTDGTRGDEATYSVYNEARDQYRWVDEGGNSIDGNTWHDDVYVGRECTTVWWRGRRYTTCVEGNGTPFQLSYQEVWSNWATRWFHEKFYWLENPVLEHETDEKNARLADICSSAKAQKILVYTIGFEVQPDEEPILQTCATTTNYYFKVGDESGGGMNLSDAFGAIASSLNMLRLTE